MIKKTKFEEREGDCGYEQSSIVQVHRHIYSSKKVGGEIFFQNTAQLDHFSFIIYVDLS